LILCQSCGEKNADDALICGKCGTRLLILGGNETWEEPEERTISLEDHLLERISNLEETLSAVLEHMARLSETLDMTDRNGFVTRSGLSSLIETLRENHIIREDPLYQRWETTMLEQMEEQRFRERFMQMKSRFIALYRGEPRKKSSFQSMIEDAEFLIYSDRVGESIETLCRALEIDPLNYELAYYLAESFQLQGLNEEAVNMLRLAIESNPEHADSLLLLALILYAEGAAEEAESLLVRTIEINPHQPLALLSMGSLMTADGRHDEAEPFLIRSVEIDPAAQGYYLLGIGMRERGRVMKAIDYLAYATELDPDHEDAVFALGLTYLERGWTRKARTCFQRAQELNPNRMELSDSELDDAEPPSNDPTMDEETLQTLELAHQLFREGKLKQALPHYRTLLRRYPENHAMLSAHAVLCYTLRRFDESLKSARKILEHDSAPLVRCVAYTMQMECLRSLSQYEDAIETMTEMLKEFPDGYGRTIACYGLALAKADTGRDLREAEMLARQALELSPEDFQHNALDALGWVFFKQGRLEEAHELLERAVGIRETLNHLYHFGMILLALNLQDEAFKVYERIVKLRNKSVNIDDFIFSAINREMESEGIQGGP